MFFNQANIVKKLLIDKVFDFEFDFSFKINTHRVYIRKVRKKLTKTKKLIVKRCIDVKIILEKQQKKVKLNCDNEINLISRKLIKKFNLLFFFIADFDTRIVDNNKLQNYSVHFLIINVIDKNDISKFFEKSFLKINMQNDLILEMFWFIIVEFSISWINKTIKWFRNSTILSINRRVEIFEFELFVEKAMNDVNVAYILFVQLYKNNFENVHSFKRMRVVASIVMKNTNEKQKIEISKKWKKYFDFFDEKKTYQLSKHDSSDYVIDLKKSKTFFYKFIYSLSKKELKIFRQYIEKHLITDFIRFFIFQVDASILFVKKSNDDLRLCVNYRNLNLLIIKKSIFFIFDWRKSWSFQQN